MIAATCADCGETFYREPAERWKVRCLSCWRATKEQPRTSDPADSNMRWYRRGYEAGHAAAIALAEGPPPPIDAERVRMLLQLAHPDKHGGSALATSVTAWLLELRKRVTA